MEASPPPAASLNFTIEVAVTHPNPNQARSILILRKQETAPTVVGAVGPGLLTQGGYINDHNTIM